jgi:hypothetical protein
MGTRLYFQNDPIWFVPLCIMCPNARGLGMPIFLMLYSADVKSGQESMALRLTIKIVFEKMRYVRPNAIIIDKYMTEFNA